MSRARSLNRILERYGQTVDLHPAGREEGLTVKAFLQPIREQKSQYLPTEVGIRRQDRFLYLGLPEAPLSGRDGTWLSWGGQRYEVETAHAIWVGDAVSHWWAVLRPGEEDV